MALCSLFRASSHAERLRLRVAVILCQDEVEHEELTTSNAWPRSQKNHAAVYNAPTRVGDKGMAQTIGYI